MTFKNTGNIWCSQKSRMTKLDDKTMAFNTTSVNVADFSCRKRTNEISLESIRMPVDFRDCSRRSYRWCHSYKIRPLNMQHFHNMRHVKHSNLVGPTRYKTSFLNEATTRYYLDRKAQSEKFHTKKLYHAVLRTVEQHRSFTKQPNKVQIIT